jgi:STE24 endopeptidase
MAWMIEWNSVALWLVSASLVVWNVEFAAALLNLRAFPTTVPAALRGLMDDDKLVRARDYLLVNSRFDIVRSLASLFLLLTFWLVGGFGWLDALTRSWAQGSVATGLIFLSIVFLGQSLASLPFAIYETFVIENRFGFNRTTPAVFAADRIKGIVLAAVIGLPLMAAVLWFFHQVAHAWLWAWLAVCSIQLLLAWLAPAVILPLFNRFTPMPEGGLKDAIRDLGTRCGFPVASVSVMDGSKRSTKANAFFTGFGRHRRIALYDTLMESCSQDELLGVLAHEIGHHRCGHIRQRLIVGLLQTAVMFFLLGIVTNPNGMFSRQLFDAFGVREISPHVGLILFAILLGPLSRVLDVVFHAWSRRQEFEADAYAACATGDAAPLASALRKMSADHLSHPCPAALRVWLDHSHPPLLARLRALGQAG